MMPRVTLLRLAVSAGTAGAGYVSFKIQEGKEWLDNKLGAVRSFLSSIDRRKAPGYAWEHRSGARDSEPKPCDGRADTHGNQEHYSGFVKKMIEIDSLLRNESVRSGDAPSISLPKIVVVGSQSSGKSSVLESLVGHSFLPKGCNMVTRRPLLLVLVNDPTAGPHDYAVFPHSTGNVRVDDFDKVAERVREMNLAVPDGQWVTDVPIELHIHSAKLPDLTLIDLPGYIAVSNRKQPAELRAQIQSLCDHYLHEPNVILAVSAADVDLANSEALQAARRHDPCGDRTIGVVTKLDLVSPEHAASVLRNSDYPLHLGYVGVVCGDAQAKNAVCERDYFASHAALFVDTEHGVEALQEKLISSLEHNLRGNIHSILIKVNDELGELRYELKARYSDNSVTAEGYLAEVVGRVREGVESLAQAFSKSAVRQLLQRELFEKHLLDVILHARESAAAATTKSDLDALVLQLTRAGWGRQCAHIVANSVLGEIKTRILDVEPMVHHPTAAGSLLAAIDSACRTRIIAAADQIENALKPYKQPDAIEFTSAEWRASHKGLVALLEDELDGIKRDMQDVNAALGGQERMRRTVERVGKQDPVRASDLHAVNRLIQLFKRQQTIQSLLHDVDKERLCHKTSRDSLFRTDDSLFITRDECQVKCPSVYLYLVSRRLLSTAALYAQDELAADQRLRLPDLLLDRHRHDPLQFAKENATVFRHIELLQRQSVLEAVRERLLKIL